MAAWLPAVVLLGTLGAVVARQVSGRGPPIWVLFVAGALVTVASGALSVPQAEEAVAGAAPVLVFLLALFLFASALEESGALDHLARWLTGRARRPSDLPVVVFVGFGIASAFLVNDALVVIGVPVLLSLTRRARLPPRPLLLTLAFAVTVGSVFTPFGNPQNLLVSLNSGVPAPTATFLRYLLLPGLASLAVGAFVLRRTFAKELRDPSGEFDRWRRDAVPFLPRHGWGQRLVRWPVLWVFPATTVVLLTFDLAALLTGGPTVPIWQTAAFGAVVLLLLTPGRAGVLRKVNWEILLLFAGLFVVVGGAAHGGLFETFARYAPIPGPSDPHGGLLAVVVSSLAGSQVVSNVPWVALEIPVLASAGYSGGTPVGWMALAGASTLAGNVSLLGAASNLIVVDLAEKAGVPIRLGTFVRYGLPIAAVSTGLLVGALWVGV